MSTRTEKVQELRSIANNQLQDPVIIIGYLEHQVDLLGKLVLDLAQVVDQTKITPEVAGRLTALNGLMAHSSVDFENITDPLQAYKLPTCIGVKSYTRRIQDQYLRAKLREGLF